MNATQVMAVAVLATGFVSTSALARAEKAEVEAHAREAVERFVSALDGLDADAFVASFTDDATLFYPQRSQPERVEGREEIRRTIEEEFSGARSRLRAAGRVEPPFLDITPLELKVQVLNETVAVVTWHVDRGTHGGRRTAVVHGRDGAWRIASLHSSNMPYPRE